MGKSANSAFSTILFILIVLVAFVLVAATITGHLPDNQVDFLRLMRYMIGFGPLS
jgi:hypothetical protein